MSQRERTQVGEGGEREKQTQCRDPDVGLDPGTLGLCPGPKAGAKPLSHPGIPRRYFIRTLGGIS